ncbi:hypothetical protein [Moritella sp. F3]|uniref:hypothetical protein n=1 Tax=Moritella sp. F3 TaxID=2718882 RepID=UPI0018E12E2D|nr:hypothetical protein [Moritella sp. F3]GIC77645.1 hypothetical protein FMO001_23720 [Moritella sp. F1]GIC82058.1 hypothetical protein FMO003_23390 [Moritella sp. F3]
MVINHFIKTLRMHGFGLVSWGYDRQRLLTADTNKQMVKSLVSLNQFSEEDAGGIADALVRYSYALDSDMFTYYEGLGSGHCVEQFIGQPLIDNHINHNLVEKVNKLVENDFDIPLEFLPRETVIAKCEEKIDKLISVEKQLNELRTIQASWKGKVLALLGIELPIVEQTSKVKVID